MSLRWAGPWRVSWPTRTDALRWAPRPARGSRRGFPSSAWSRGMSSSYGRWWRPADPFSRLRESATFRRPLPGRSSVACTPMTAADGLMPLTVIIPTLDEVQVIGERVRELAWAAEVIVADGGSSDGTVEAARAAGARVLEHAGGSIAAQRNAAIAAASHGW